MPWVLENQPTNQFSSFDQPNRTHGGPDWFVDVPSAVTALRWYRDGPNRSSPDNIKLWRVGDQFPMVVKSPVIDDFTTGWQVTPLEVPIQIQAGVSYTVSTDTNSAGGHGSRNLSPLAAPPTGIHYSYDGRRNTATGTFGFPPQVSSQNHFTFDAFIEAGDPPYPGYGGIATSDISAELARWLTPGGDLYAGSALELIYGQANGANTNAQAAHQTAQEVQTSLATHMGVWTAALAAKLDTAADTVGAWLTTEAEWYKKLVHDTADPVAAFLDKLGTYTGVGLFDLLAELIRWANGVYDRPQLADTDDWELLDETDFADNLLWPVEADIYRVTLSAFDPAGTSETVGTETRHGYLGKWCPFNVQFSSEWHYFNTASADLYVGGRMPGLGLILYRPGAGHVQAWRRKEAV